MDFEGLRGLAAIENFAVRRAERANSAWVREFIEDNSVLVLATTDGDQPWVAPLEYMADEDLNLYFFSTTEARHVRHLEANSAVAVTVFVHKQPTVTATTTVDLSGVQMECTATRVPQEEHTDAVSAAIDAFHISIPPYAVFKVVPHRIYVPRIENGLNIRYEVDMS
jgi:nitroimidazol reductase NimA-like FMN-containing flavoprotein (pyridoxamine 5'-phosphate oxidase superfamily)